MKYTAFLFIGMLLHTTLLFSQGVCAHRGDNKAAPENTLHAITSAVKKGAHQIEFDVYLSKDNELVVIHDASVDRTTDGSGKISEMTLAEIKKLDAGSWFDAAFKSTQIPTLRQVLEAIPEYILCNVEIKGGPEVAAQTARIIATRDRTGQCFLTIPGNRDDLAEAARKEVPDIQLCKGFPADVPIQAADMSFKPDTSDATVNLKVNYIQLFYFKPEKPPYDVIKKTVETLHQNGIKVNYCCANKEQAIREIAETGVDYILTDDVDLCLGVVHDFGVEPARRP